MNISPGFLVLTAFIYYAGGGGALTAFFSAALAHELGHLAAMWALGAEISRVRITFGGPVLEYGGAFSGRQELCVLAAGPLGGMLFGLLCFSLHTEYFTYVGAIALLATLFNLLPVVPMDGGRLMQILLEEVMPETHAAVVMRLMGNLCAVGVVVTGLWFGFLPVAVMGIWMAALANRRDLR